MIWVRTSKKKRSLSIGTLVAFQNHRLNSVSLHAPICRRYFVANERLARLEKSRSQRILWLLEELSLPYELKTYKRVNMLAPPELKEIHPLGKSPIIKIESDAVPNDKPLVLAESGYMVEYLIDHFGPQLAPNKWRNGMEGKVGGETEEWLRYRYYMHYAEGSLMSPLLMSLLFNSKLLADQGTVEAQAFD